MAPEEAEGGVEMGYSLKDRVALVTGASSGIGMACAIALARNGTGVIINGRRRERLEALSKQLQDEHSGRVLVLPFDVRNLSQVKSALSEMPREWKSVDVLVNNAGLARGFDYLQEGSIDDWEEMIDSNIKGLLYTTRLILPGMLERGKGHVVNIASTAGLQTYPRGNVYCATKSAVRFLSDGLRQDLLGTPIRVTTISPGIVETEFSQVRFRGDKERAAQVYRGLTPLTAEDVADAVVYCLTRPPHVDISEIVMMPTDQAGPTLVHRRK